MADRWSGLPFQCTEATRRIIQDQFPGKQICFYRSLEGYRPCGAFIGKKNAEGYAYAKVNAYCGPKAYIWVEILSEWRGGENICNDVTNNESYIVYNNYTKIERHNTGVKINKCSYANYIGVRICNEEGNLTVPFFIFCILNILVILVKFNRRYYNGWR